MMNQYEYANLILSPVEIKKLVNTDIAVETKSSDSFRGYLKTIDPVSHTLVLQMHTRAEKQISIKLIPSHTIRRVYSYDKKINDSDRQSFEQFVQGKLRLHSMDSTKETREKIMKLLAKNKLPAKIDSLDESIIVDDICKIKMPYREEDIECANYKVAKNLKAMLQGAFLKWVTQLRLRKWFNRSWEWNRVCIR